MISAEYQDEADRDFVASLARGLDVLSAFSRFAPRMTLSEVAKVTNMSRATARRLLLTLVREGYAEKTGRIYSLRPKVLQLGYSALSSAGMLDIVQPVMNGLMQRTNESVFTAVLTGHEVTFLARSTPDRVMAVDVDIGLRLPAYGASTGRILLAWEPAEALDRYLEEIDLAKHTPNTITSRKKLRQVIEESRKQGYALVDEELEAGVRGLAVPLFDSHDRAVAALNLCCPSSRFTVEQMISQLLPEAQEAAERINQALRNVEL